MIYPGLRPEIDVTYTQPPAMRAPLSVVRVRIAPNGGMLQTPLQDKNFNLLPQFQTYAVSEQPYMIATQRYLYNGLLYGYYPMERKYG